MSHHAEPPRTHAPHVFVADVDAPELSPEDRHHLSRVLRLPDGAPLVVSDGHGRWRACRLGAALAVDGDVHVVAPASPSLTVAFAVPKGDRPELVVQKLTELGVDRIVPLFAERSVVRWDRARSVKHLERLRRVAREAAMQSRRLWLPVVDEPCGLADLVAAHGGAVVLAERDGAAPSLAHPVVAVGPEGGWTDAERAVAPHVALGGGVLRAETAAIAAAAVLTALRDGLVDPVARRSGT
jgi:16S rRNA (uracil1498-N3)-methyltransferase